MNTSDIFEMLTKDCRPYLDALQNCKKGHFLLRGFFYQIDDYKKFQHNLEFRKPKNMLPDIHNKINSYFEPIFNWKIRNGIFCYGFDILKNEPIDLGYGVFYLFFPIGEFSYVYSTEHFDLFGFIDRAKENIDDLIEELVFRDDNFCDVMILRDEYNNFGNEVSVKANSYYLVNTRFAESFSKKIWD